MMKRTQENPYVARAIERSPILNERQRTIRNVSVQEHSIDNLQSHIYLIEGTKENPGFYYDGERHQLERSFLPILEEDLVEVEKDFQRHKQNQINSGNEPTEQWPANLLEKRQRLEASISVRRDELVWLASRIEELKAEVVEEKQYDFKKKHPLNWPPGGSLRGGVLESINGQRCSVGNDGILFIDEPESPYNQLLVHMFKGLIMMPLGAEYRYRCREETKLAKAENRPPKKVDYPPPPIYKEGEITYPNYHKDWVKIKKLKK